MDEQEIRDLWKKIVKEQDENSESGNKSIAKENLTFKGYSIPQNKRPSLPRLTFSQQDMVELFSDENQEDQEIKIEHQNTIIDNFAKIKNLNIGNPSANYQIFNEIARGGMGIIYRGKQLSLQREVAVKKLLQNNNVQLQDKFINEAIVTAFLDHPNIIAVHELGVNEDGEIVLAMKLVKGTSWKDILHKENEQSKKYDSYAHINILLNVCNAVAFAHSKNIIHCDLKPDNIMIGSFGEILVMDWGIAVDIGNDDDKKALAKKDVKSPMGTPHYMPEELARGHGHNIGPWTDIYLLGGILYEIISQKPPHKGSNIWQVINSALEGAKLDFPPGTSSELQEICKKSLQKNHEQRYQTISQFSQEISSFLQHRESIIISDKAQLMLEECDHTVSKVTSSQLILQKRERSQLYDQFAQCVARFQQSIELWDKNQYAQKGIEEAYLRYAQIALHNGDLGLAEAQISKLSYHLSEVKALKDKIQLTKINKLRNFKNNQMVRSALKVSLVTIITVLIVSVILVYNNAKEANKQRHLAEEKRIEADNQRQIADEKRIEADNQKQIADEKRIEADRQKEEAKLLQTQKTIDAHRSRIKLAQIALNKSLEADKREEWDRSGAYAGEALEFIKDIEIESTVLEEEYQVGIIKEVTIIKNIAQQQIEQALQNRYLLWQTPSAKNIFSENIKKICLANDLIATTSKNHIHFWTVNGEIITSITNEKEILDIALHPRFKIIAFSDGNSIKLWDFERRIVLNEIVKHHKNIKQVMFSPDGQFLIYLENNLIKLWNISLAKNKKSWTHKKVQKVIFCDNQLISIATDNSIKEWSLETDNLPSIEIKENILSSTFIGTHDGFSYCNSDSNVINNYNLETKKITKIVTNHKTAIKILMFIAPKNFLVSVSEDNTIKIWNKATGDLVETIDENKNITNIAVLPHSLEQMIILFKNEIKIYDLSRQIPHHFPGHKHKINLLAFSHDGKKILSSCESGKIKLWKTETGNLNYTFTGHSDKVKSLAFAPNMKFFVSGGSEKDSKSYLWNMETKVMSLISEHNNQSVSGICYSNDGEMLAISSGENIVSLWQANPLKRINYFAHTSSIQNIFFAKDNKILVSVSYLKESNQSTISWWNVNTSNQAEFTLKIQGEMTLSALSTDGSTLVGVIDRKVLHFWDINSRSLLNKLESTAFDIQNIAVSSNMLAINTTNENNIKILDIYNGNLVFSLPVNEKVSSMALSPKGNLLAFSSNDRFQVWQIPTYIVDSFAGNKVALDPRKERLAVINNKTLTIWDMETEKKEKVYTHNESIYSVLFHPHKDILFLADPYKTIMWDVKEQKTISHKILGTHLVYSNDGKKIATNDQNVKIIIWDAILEKEKLEITFFDIFGDVNTKNSEEKTFFSLKFSPDNRLLAITFKNIVVLWDIEKNRKYDEKVVSESISCLIFNPSGTEIFMAGSTVLVWKIFAKEEFLMEKIATTITQICVLDEYRIATSTTNGKIIIWDTEKKRKTLIFSAQTQAVRSLVFIREKQALVCAGDDYHITVWQLPRQRKINFNNSGHSKYKFYISEKQKWEIDINTRDNPRQNVQKLFEYNIGNDLSASPIYTPLFLWH